MVTGTSILATCPNCWRITGPPGAPATRTVTSTATGTWTWPTCRPCCPFMGRPARRRGGRQAGVDMQGLLHGDERVAREKVQTPALQVCNVDCITRCLSVMLESSRRTRRERIEKRRVRRPFEKACARMSSSTSGPAVSSPRPSSTDNRARPEAKDLVRGLGKKGG